MIDITIRSTPINSATAAYILGQVSTNLSAFDNLESSEIVRSIFGVKEVTPNALDISQAIVNSLENKEDKQKLLAILQDRGQSGIIWRFTSSKKFLIELSKALSSTGNYLSLTLIAINETASSTEVVVRELVRFNKDKTSFLHKKNRSVEIRPSVCDELHRLHDEAVANLEAKYLKPQPPAPPPPPPEPEKTMVELRAKFGMKLFDETLIHPCVFISAGQQIFFIRGNNGEIYLHDYVNSRRILTLTGDKYVLAFGEAADSGIIFNVQTPIDDFEKEDLEKQSGENLATCFINTLKNCILDPNAVPEPSQSKPVESEPETPPPEEPKEEPPKEEIPPEKPPKEAVESSTVTVDISKEELPASEQAAHPEGVKIDLDVQITPGNPEIKITGGTVTDNATVGADFAAPGDTGETVTVPVQQPTITEENPVNINIVVDDPFKDASESIVAALKKIYMANPEEDMWDYTQKMRKMTELDDICVHHNDNTYLIDDKPEPEWIPPEHEVPSIDLNDVKNQTSLLVGHFGVVDPAITHLQKFLKQHLTSENNVGYLATGTFPTETNIIYTEKPYDVTMSIVKYKDGRFYRVFAAITNPGLVEHGYIETKDIPGRWVKLGRDIQANEFKSDFRNRRF